MADAQLVKRLVDIHQGWFEDDVARFPSVYQKQQFEKALALHEQRETCQHEFEPTGYGGLTDRVYECRKCGEQEERDIS